MERNKKIEQIFNEHYKDIYKYAFFKLKNKEEAEDIAAEAFIKLAALGDLDSIQNPKAWLVTVSHNLIIDKYKKSKEVLLNEELDGFIDEKVINISVNKNLENSVINETFLNIIKEEIYKLDSVTAEVITLKIWQELTFGEIAKVLNIKESTAKLKYYRGLEKTKEQVQKKDHKLFGISFPILLAGIWKLGVSNYFMPVKQINYLSIMSQTMEPITQTKAAGASKLAFFKTTAGKVALGLTSVAVVVGAVAVGIVVNNNQKTENETLPTETPEEIEENNEEEPEKIPEEVSFTPKYFYVKDRVNLFYYDFEKNREFQIEGINGVQNSSTLFGAGADQFSADKAGYAYCNISPADLDTIATYDCNIGIIDLNTNRFQAIKTFNSSQRLGIFGWYDEDTYAYYLTQPNRMVKLDDGAQVMNSKEEVILEHNGQSRALFFGEYIAGGRGGGRGDFASMDFSNDGKYLKYNNTTGFTAPVDNTTYVYSVEGTESFKLEETNNSFWMDEQRIVYNFLPEGSDVESAVIYNVVNRRVEDSLRLDPTAIVRGYNADSNEILVETLKLAEGTGDIEYAGMFSINLETKAKKLLADKFNVYLSTPNNYYVLSNVKKCTEFCYTGVESDTYTLLNFATGEIIPYNLENPTDSLVK